MAGPPLIFALVARNDGDVKSVDDLKGSKVGISTVGSATSWLMNEVSRQHGWGYDGLTRGTDRRKRRARRSAEVQRHRRLRRQSSRSALNFADHGDGRIF